jgi:DNA-binding NtrC family response regulator
MARVLVVEDDSLVRKSVHRILERAGHEVWESAGAKTALHMLTVVPMDLIITDVYMPGMNGLELMAHLTGRHAAQHVIAMTGGGVVRPAGDLLDEARRIGADATIEKPFGPRELNAVVDGVLAEQTAA